MKIGGGILIEAADWWLVWLITCWLSQTDLPHFSSHGNESCFTWSLWHIEHIKSAQTVNTFKSMLQKASFLYKLNRHIYNYHNQSNCVPVIRVYY